MKKSMLILALSSLLVTSCGYVQNSGEKLQHDVMKYNVALRWKQIAIAKNYMAAEVQNALLEELGKLFDSVEIVEYEILSVERKENKATVDVMLAWYTPPSMSVKHAVYRQIWSYRSSSWQLIEQKIFKKETMGLQTGSKF